MDRSKIQDKIHELIGTGDVVDVTEDSFRIEFRYHETSFDDLSKISEAFGTKNINLGTEERSEGYCETCHYSYTVNIVRVESIPESIVESML